MDWWQRLRPAISGSRIVWIENHKDSGFDGYWLRCQDLSTGVNQAVTVLSSYVAHLEGKLAFPTIYGSRVAWTVENDSMWNTAAFKWEIGMKDLAAGTTFTIGNNVRDGYPNIYGNYVVFERDTVLANSDIYLYNIDLGIEDRVTNGNGSQIRPAISTNYGNYIVYMDNRNGNWDIYLTAFGYGVGATGPSNRSTPSPSLGNTVNSDNQGLITIMVSATAIVAVAVVGAAAFMAKQRKSRKPNN